MMTNTPTFKQRRTAGQLYFAGLFYMALNLVLEQVFQVWGRLGNGEQTSQVMAFAFNSFLLFCMGLGFTFSTRKQMMGWGYPNAASGDFGTLDERQKLQFLEAQAKAQRIYVVLALLGSFSLMWQGNQGYSWFFALQLAVFLMALVTGLPTALMVQGERDLGDEE